jgi:hypothetical protein
MEDIVSLKAQISVHLKDADSAELDGRHVTAMMHLGDAANKIRRVRDAEELARQEMRHDIAAMECAHGG